MMRVIRGYKYDHLIVVDGQAYPGMALRDAAFEIVKNAGGHVFDAPPFFYTGSPYADAILRLARDAGIEPEEVPPDMDVAILPQSTKRAWTARKPLWEDLFLLPEERPE